MCREGDLCERCDHLVCKNVCQDVDHATRSINQEEEQADSISGKGLGLIIENSSGR